MAGAPIATIGAGTGLGECFLTPGEGGHYVAYPSEGGHAEFPPRTETEVRASVGRSVGVGDWGWFMGGRGLCFLSCGYMCPCFSFRLHFPPPSIPSLQQFHLLEFLKQRFEQKHRVSVERVVSGPGIANVYDFLADHYPDKVDKEIDAGALCVLRCGWR